MAQKKDPGKDSGYTLEEILAEYGSGRKDPPSNVVEFPEPELLPPPSRPKQDKPPSPDKHQASPAPVDRIVPKHLGRSLAARLSTLLRRADHYADHMYDQAEPDEATRRAEKYVPGVDREEVPERPQRRRRSPLDTAEQIPPDTPPADLAARWAPGFTSRYLRVGFSLLLCLVCIAASLDLPFFSWEQEWTLLPIPLPQARLFLLAGLLVIVGALCFDVIGRGIARLFTLRPNAETLAALAWGFTVADGVRLALQADRSGLPCCAITALSLTFSLWGATLRRRGDRISAKTAAQARTPYVVTLDENKWSGRPAYSKWSGSAAGFGSQLQMEDGTQRAWRIAAPLLIVAVLLCAGMTGVVYGIPRALWTASACFTASASWAVPFAYALPYRKLTTRLHKVGAALAGWPGVSRCRQGGILMSDLDLFPPGSVRIAQVKIFGGVSTEKVVAYTATLLRVLGCGLTRPFHDLLRAQGSIYREVSGVRHHEGGLSGIIRNHEVLVGTAAFMHMMEVALPQGHKIKNAVFCSIDGQLVGMFPLEYSLNDAVNPALSALMREEVSPILVTRDFNLIPSLLERKFKLPVDRMEFPPVERRLELSDPHQEHDSVPVALLCREGLTALADAVVGARRLHTLTRRSTALALIGTVLGVFLTFYLSFVGAWNSLTPFNFLVFMAAWLLTELLLANWINQY